MNHSLPLAADVLLSAADVGGSFNLFEDLKELMVVYDLDNASSGEARRINSADC
jgi:hypothetical protein